MGRRLTISSSRIQAYKIQRTKKQKKCTFKIKVSKTEEAHIQNSNCQNLKQGLKIQSAENLRGKHSKFKLPKSEEAIY